jgi:hypothetical protein
MSTKESKVSRDAAEQDVSNWLDYRKMNDSKRESLQKDVIDPLIAAVEEGLLVVNDDFTLTQKFKFPIMDKDNAVDLSSVTYSARLQYRDVKRHLKNIKSDDGIGMIHAHRCGLTDQPMAKVELFDLSDLGIARIVASLFL